LPPANIPLSIFQSIGFTLAARTATQLERIHEILCAYGTVPSLCAQKPA
jgi:hypothetical protein